MSNKRSFGRYVQMIKDMNRDITNVGIIKEIDSLGRIVIPKDFRERLALDKEVEIILTDNGIIIHTPEYTLVKISETKNGSI